MLAYFAPSMLATMLPVLLKYVPNSGEKQRYTPDGPPASEKEWRKMSFEDRINRAARDVGARSPSKPGAYIHHMRLWTFVLCTNWAILWLVPRPADMDGDEWAWQAYIKTIMFHQVCEVTGFSKQGALWGGREWPDAWKFALTPGTMKQPMTEFATLIPRLFGSKDAPDVWKYDSTRHGGWLERAMGTLGVFSDTRGFLDVLRFATFIILSLGGCLMPRLPGWLVPSIVALTAMQMVGDFHMWLQCVGYSYMYLLFPCCFSRDAGGLAGTQMIILLQRIGCGVAKSGAWWPFVFGRYSQSHPWVRESENYRSLVNAGADDFSPSDFVKANAKVAAAFEILAPVLCFCTFSPTLVYASLACMHAMHVFIIFGPAFIDVVAWNYVFITSDMYLFAYPSAHKPLPGFDWVGLSKAPLLLLAFLFLDLLAVTIANQFPESHSRYFRHAHYAGNWPKTAVMLKKSAEPKLLKNLVLYGNLPWGRQKQAHGSLDAEYSSYITMAYDWLFQLNSKIAPAATKFALDLSGEPAEKYFFVGPHNFMEGLSGAGCDGQQAARFCRSLARKCDLEPYDLVTTDITPFALFSSFYVPGLNEFPEDKTVAKWMIHDSVLGELASGSLTMKDCHNIADIPSSGFRFLEKHANETHISANALKNLKKKNAKNGRENTPRKSIRLNGDSPQNGAVPSSSSGHYNTRSKTKRL